MVEMTEAANILNNATSRSLVILDEIGRGTSTYDGLSLAWAMTEYLHHHVGCRALFATHYHELSKLQQSLPRLRNYTVRVKESPDGVIFLHQIAPGSADKSYGIHVARMAGVPEAVLNRAEQVLATLERNLTEETVPSRKRPAKAQHPTKPSEPTQKKCYTIDPPELAGPGRKPSSQRNLFGNYEDD
jgi:DNA mismatch repair protein MutS